jgi:hypothetical protein
MRVRADVKACMRAEIPPILLLVDNHADTFAGLVVGSALDTYCSGDARRSTERISALP